MNVKRLTPTPIVSVSTHPAAGDNINGPSLIRVPPWVKHPLGRYYLYFAHHNGRSIRLAFADALTGPWTVLAEEVMSLTDSGFQGHIASPDVHADKTNQRLLMYFHGCDSETDDVSPQFTRLAASSDGVGFSAISGNLGAAYWRVFQWQQYLYTLEMPGVLKRAHSPRGPFETGPQLFDERMRHSAVVVNQDTLDVYFSRVGDNPESILHTRIELRDDWHRWRTGRETVVASPQGAAEGASLPAIASTRGIAETAVRQLRDPAIFEEEGVRYLLFSVAGEQGISIAALGKCCRPMDDEG